MNNPDIKLAKFAGFCYGVKRAVETAVKLKKENPDKNIYILGGINIKDLDIKTDEIEDLWKSFYNTIGIKERKNDRCRMNFMPKKYWKYILEVENEEIGK